MGVEHSVMSGNILMSCVFCFQSVYYGSPREVTQFFTVAGYPMEAHYNTADFICMLPASQHFLKLQ